MTVAVVAMTASLLQPTGAASAADGRLFDPGNIVSDAIFYDGGAMNEAQVQGFLQSQVPACRGASGCLTTIRGNTPSMAAAPGRCAALDAVTNESAASMIARVGAACGISQKAILVTLQKEQGLVTNSAPSQAALNAAMGMACPDTAPCDPAYSGLFYQIYWGARQFKNYVYYASSFNYRAGRINSIAFNPNAGCGKASVYIVNNATAGLYNYTPYVPNAAALNNLYGTGDACSSYGNRNFWRIFSDWFGSPTLGTSLVMNSQGDVYVISGDTKYHIPDQTMLTAYSPLGAVARVSDSVLAAYTTSHPATRIIRNSSGGIFFQDAGIRLGLSTCEMVVNYGGACDPSGYTQLTDWQVAQFVEGPSAGSVLGTNAGFAYAISAGSRREIFDPTSASAAGLAAWNQILTEAAVADMPVGPPIIRDDVLIRNRNGGYGYYYQGRVYTMSARTGDQSGIASRTEGMLLQASVAQLTGGGTFIGAISTPDGTFVLGPGGRYRWSTALAPMGLASVPASSSFIQRFSDSGTIEPGSFVKAPGDNYVYLVSADKISQISTWDTYLALSGNGAKPIIPLTDELIAALPKGPVVLSSASLIVAPSSPAVYFIDGNQRIFVGSFDVPSAAGVTGYVRVSDATMSSYPVADGWLGYAYNCGGTVSFAAGGFLHPLSSDLVNRYRLSARTMGSSTCAVLRTGAPATQFVRVPSGAIYYIDDGMKRPIPSMERFAQLGGTSTNYIQVDDGFASTFVDGPLA